MKKISLILCIGLALVLAGCQNLAENNLETETTPDTNTAGPDINANQPAEETGGEQNAGLANPASTNCIEKGGTLEIRKNKNGEYGVCLFEDNQQCEEWALLRGDCPVGGMKITGYENNAEIFCAITGGQVENMDGTTMCKRIDGTYCNAQSNLDGECPSPYGENPNAGNAEAP